MRLIPINEVRVGSELAIDILDENFRKLLPKTHKLSNINLQRLRTTNIASVYITDKYCTLENNYGRYTNESANMIDKILKIKKAIFNSAMGINTNESVALGLKTIHQIIQELDAQKDNLKIAYEPQKISIEDFGEQMVYIAIMSGLFALKLGFNKAEATVICLGAILKDIAVMSPAFKGTVSHSSKLHPVKGYQYLKTKYNFPESVLQIVLQHHELYDGKGYPRNLKGDEICAGARIIAIIEMFYKLKTTNLNQGGKALQADITKGLSYYDPNYFAEFKKHVTIFDPDMLVLLTNGDIATVTSAHAENPFKPQVKIIKSMTYGRGVNLNLSEVDNLEIYRVIYYID
ncbi:MAG: hypothetical protein ATN35_07980 [Epulopiscium sp. Nele67-Bin004]|nr:MAG: hypothetical protein ATN35_07980 [Epulopiscium sp. Nele67-Bin004]